MFWNGFEILEVLARADHRSVCHGALIQMGRQGSKSGVTRCGSGSVEWAKRKSDPNAQDDRTSGTTYPLVVTLVLRAMVG